MATEPKSPEVTTPEAKTPDPKPAPKVEPKLVYIKTIYGRMVDPHTALEYSQVPSELLKRTSWVESQLQAKKMELVDL